MKYRIRVDVFIEDEKDAMDFFKALKKESGGRALQIIWSI